MIRLISGYILPRTFLFDKDGDLGTIQTRRKEFL